jgi:hypothetical protein
VSRFLVVVLTLWPLAAAAQPWHEALRAGNEARAAALLHEIVLSQAATIEMPRVPNADAVRALAALYAGGRGVASDPIAACTLAWLGQVAEPPRFTGETIEAARAWDARHTAWTEEGIRLMRAYCDPLAADDREAAMRSIGCFAFGMPETTTLVGDVAVRIGRLGIRPAGAPADKGVPLVNCPQVIARARALTLAPPEDAAPGVGARHFVEMLAWHAGGDATLRYVLFWSLYEVRDGGVRMALLEPVIDAASPSLQPELDRRLTIEMIRSGHIRWRIEAMPPRRGWIMLEEGRR